MGLIKECRCGKIIDYTLKYCDECEAKANKNRREAYKEYDKTQRNQDSKAIYNSSKWIRLREECKHKFKGVDIYSYYVLGNFDYGSICHHIEEVTMNDSRVYDLNNLIYVTDMNHRKIHKLYEQDYEGTKRMLFSLVDRWNKEVR